MIGFDITKFTDTLALSGAFTPRQIDALAEALGVSTGDTAVSGESHEAAPLRGAASDLL